MPKFNIEAANPGKAEVCTAHGMSAQNLHWEQQVTASPSSWAVALWAEAVTMPGDSLVSEFQDKPSL